MGSQWRRRSSTVNSSVSQCVLCAYLSVSASPRGNSSPNLPPSLLTFYRTRSTLLLMANRAEIPYGTLDLMVLKTLDTLGPQHGYGIARRIEQAAESSLELNQGTIYPALLRLEQKGWISSEWGASDNNRKARFYSITRAGRKQLAAETESWSRTVAMMARLLESESCPPSASSSPASWAEAAPTPNSTPKSPPTSRSSPPTTNAAASLQIGRAHV